MPWRWDGRFDRHWNHPSGTAEDDVPFGREEESIGANKEQPKHEGLKKSSSGNYQRAAVLLDRPYHQGSPRSHWDLSLSSTNALGCIHSYLGIRATSCRLNNEHRFACSLCDTHGMKDETVTQGNVSFRRLFNPQINSQTLRPSSPLFSRKLIHMETRDEGRVKLAVIYIITIGLSMPSNYICTLLHTI